MAHERDGHTLQTTAVVHEAHIRLAGQEKLDPSDQAHFFSAVRIGRSEALFATASANTASTFDFPDGEEDALAVL